MKTEQPSTTFLFRYTFGDVVFDEATGSLSVAGQPVRIERKPAALLSEFLRRPKETLSKDELFQTLWPGGGAYDQLLTNAVTKLRSALSGSAGAASMIRSVKGVGYVFEADVERIATGRKPVGKLEIHAGQRAPGDGRYYFKGLLAANHDCEVWLAEEPQSRERRVYKIAGNAAAGKKLQEEYAIWRQIQERGGGSGVIDIVEAQFSAVPNYLASAWYGVDLFAWSMEEDGLAALPPEQRITLAASIAREVARLHNAGVIHRDIKPENVLIRRDGAAWRLALADLGSGLSSLEGAGAADPLPVARRTITEDGLSEGLASSPQYIAPELTAGAPASIQSDVYSLGVILAQLVIGDLREPITFSRIEAISDPLLRGDIIAATHNDPQRRVQTAAELAERLETLDHRREEAGRLAAMESAAAELARRKREARQRLPFVAALAAAILAGSVASLVFGLREAAAREASDLAGRRSAATASFLQQILVSADPRSSEGGPDLSIRNALNRAAETVETTFAGDDAAIAEVSVTLGNVFAGLGDPRAAIDQFRRGVERLKTVVPPGHEDLIGARFALAEALAAAGSLGEGMREASEATAEAGGEERLSPIMQARAIHLRARQKHGSMQLVEARDDYRAAADLMTRLEKEGDPAYAEQRPYWIYSAVLGIIDTSSQAGDPEAANAAIASLDTLEGSRIGVPVWLQANRGMIVGKARAYVGQYEEAEQLLTEARDLFIRLYGQNAVRTADAENMLGYVYGSTGRNAEALRQMQLAADITCKAVGERNMNCLASNMNAGVLSLKAGQTDKALQLLTSAREGFQAMSDSSEQGAAFAPALVFARFHLANAWLDKGDVKKARAELEGVTAEALQPASPDSLWEPRLAAQAARLEYLASRTAQNRTAYRKALDAMREAGVDAQELEQFGRSL